MLIVLFFVSMLLTMHNAFSIDSFIPHVNNAPVKMIVTVPITNLYLQPGVIQHAPKSPCLYKDNPLLTSQLLYSEFLLAFDKKKDSSNNTWFQVYALEQKEHVSSIGSLWKMGWVLADDVQQITDFPTTNLVVRTLVAPIVKEPTEKASILFYVFIGTKLLGKQIQSDWFRLTLPNGKDAYISQKDIYYNHPYLKNSPDEIRRNISDTASLFIQNSFGPNYYSCGGRSPCCPLFKNQQTGTDPAGLINLTYRANGFELPRTIEDQYELCEEIAHGKDVKPGDLIFFADKEDQDKINHVAIYIHEKSLGDYIIECLGEEPYITRTLSDVTRLGKNIKHIDSGDLCKNKFVIFFGSFLNNQKLMNRLHDESLKTYFPEFRELSLTWTPTGPMA